MEIFLDTASVEEVKEAVAFGLIDGVTTNPSLIAKSGRDLQEVAVAMCKIVQGPVSAEVISTDYEGMKAEAQRLASWNEHIVVKVPLTPAGLRVVSELSPQGIRFNVTLCFSVNQALLAAKAGAAYISPFVGRWDDIDTKGIELIPKIVKVYENYGYPTKVLVASIRSPNHVSESALVGAQVVTIPPKIFNQMMKHPLTDIGLEKFLADYRASQSEG